MGKKEKYIEFVVNDIISNSIFHETKTGGEIIEFPFSDTGVRLNMLHTSIQHFRKVYGRSYKKFINGLQSKYGASSDEFESIWDGISEKGLKLWW